MENVFYTHVGSYQGDELLIAVDKIFAQSNNAKQLTSSTRVLLKPNLLAKHAPSAAVTTHPAVVNAVICALKKRGINDITLADSPGGVYTKQLMNAIYNASGLAQVCKAQNVKLYTDCKYKTVKTNGKLVREWNLIEPVCDTDFIINLPKIKTHMMMNLTCGVKNLFGCVPGLQKAEFHMQFSQKELFAEMLVDLHEAVKPSLTIADGIVAMEGDGPAGGKPRTVGVIMAADNTFALDLSVARLLNFQSKDVEYLAIAINRGLCGTYEEFVHIIGDELSPIIDFKHPSSASLDFGKSVPKAFKWLLPVAQNFAAPHPSIKHTACIGCGKCAEICPACTIVIKDKKAIIKKVKCIRCFCCHEVCPVKAISVKRFKLMHKI